MSFTKQTVKDLDVNGKRVLVRAPLNVPIKDGQVVDQMRVKAVVPTIQYLIDQGAKVILLSHHSKEGQSLEPVVPVLKSLLGREVTFLPDCIAEDCVKTIQQMQPGDVAVAENLRFHKEEEANDDAFAKKLADLGDLYIDDDFPAMHRAHASIVGIPKYLPAAVGFLVEKEVNTITAALENPKRPLIAIVAGAKISTKIELLNNLLSKVDAVLVGGAMANTFLAAQGKSVGKSLYESDQMELAHNILKKADEKKIKLFLPVDVVVATDLEAGKDVRTISADEVGPADIIADVGPSTIDQLRDVLAEKGTVIWNGPMGITENKAFRSGSEKLANAIIQSGSTSIIGGGDTAAFLDSAGLTDKFTFVSTGGGASLELMSGKTLPGLAALKDK